MAARRAQEEQVRQAAEEQARAAKGTKEERQRKAHSAEMDKQKDKMLEMKDRPKPRTTDDYLN